MPNVEITRSSPFSQIICVLGKAACAAGGEVFLRFIDGFGESIGSPE
jgi:hypothetical protein